MAKTKYVQGVGNVTEGKGGMTVGKKSGSYDTKTGQYSIKDLATGKTTTGSGSQADYDKAYSSYGTSSGGGGGGGSSSSQSSYQDSLTKSQNMLAEQAAKAKQDALRQAWESNSQALNSQKSTVTNNYNSATNKLNAVRDARLPEFQQQRNAASADAAQTSRGVKELMAATGRYNSGFNRSEQLGVDLNRSNAISGITGAQNQFETDVGNQLSDVDAQRVAALNDIASKLQLGEKQYNDGTLSLTEQLESEKASGALKAMMDAQTWADQKSQQEFDNSYKTDSLAQQARLNELTQAFNDKKLELEQDSILWEQQFKEKGFTAEEAFNAAQLKLERDTLAAEMAYKYKSLAKSGSSGGGGSSSANLSAIKYQNELSSKQALASAMQGLQAMANAGKTRSQLLAHINSNAADIQANNVPVQDLYKWASSNFTWDKKNGEWYNTEDED